MLSTLKVWYELQEVQAGLSILSIHTMFLSVFAFLKIYKSMKGYLKSLISEEFIHSKFSLSREWDALAQVKPIKY